MPVINAFQYFTAEVLNDFTGSGLQKLLEEVLKPEQPGSISNHISCIFTETLLALDEKLIDVCLAAQFFKAAITNIDAAQQFCQVCDVYPSFDLITEILNILKEDTSILSHTIMAENLDSKILITIGIVPADVFNRQLNTKRRDHYYTQKKFNLFHEEFEGYSLVLNKIEDLISSPHNLAKVDYAVDAVNLLIGHYLLDPNRVLDLLLDIFANYLVGNHEFIIQFLRKSPWWPKQEASCLNGFTSLNTGGCMAASNSIALQMKKFPGPELQETFKILVAILIKEGFISFGSIYETIPPGNDAMDLLEKKYKEHVEQEIFRASANALALAAPLKDDENESENANTAVNSTSIGKTEEQTLESLLMLNIKLQMLRCFLSNGLFWPSLFILSQYPFLAHLDKDVGELMIRLFAELINPLYEKLPQVTSSILNSLQQKKQAAFIIKDKLVLQDPETTIMYCFKPNIKNHGGKLYVYFYSEWVRDLPICNTEEDLFQVSHQFLKFFGPIITQNNAVFIQLCEIIAHSLEINSSIENKARWFDYFRNYLFPYIGCMEDNPVAVDKAFSVLQFFDCDERFNLYGELNQVIAKNNSFVRISFGKAEKATKDTLKRLSKENVGQMMKKLAKISISNPLPCFLTIIQQIESYDNLNSLIVDTAAQFTRYGWDNMTLALLMRLLTAGRSNVLGNGLSDRKWIQSLASFIGQLCQRYPHKIDINSIISYFLKSLHTGDNTQLLVLKEILSCMGGFQAITNLTQLQVNMISCEPTLSRIVFQTIGDTRYSCKVSGEKLAQVLLTDNRGSEFFVLLTQLDEKIMADQSLSHLKILACRKDEVNAILHLFCTLFSFFCHDLPSLVSLYDLVNDYDVSVPWAFEVWRKFLPQKADTSLKKFLTTRTLLNVDLFYSFWKWNLYDLNYSEEVYEAEMTKLKSSLFQQKEELNFLISSGENSTKTGPIAANISRIEEFINEMPQLKVAQATHNEKITELIRSNSVDWFSAADGDYILRLRQFLQDCILPRAIHSCFDAIYSAKFLFKLHEKGVSGFSVIALLQELFEKRILFSTLFTSTPTEAENLGLFLSVILQELGQWRETENFTKLTQNMPLKRLPSDEKPVAFAEFKQILYNHHSVILEDISRALKATSYMSRMNAITFLKNLLNIYPIVEDHCEEIITLIEDVSKYDSRDDLKLSSAALIGHVKSREARWVHMWDFHDMEDDSKVEHQKKRESIAEEKKEKIAQKEKVQAEKVKRDAVIEQKRRKEALERAESERNSQSSASSLNYSESATTSAEKGPVDRVKNLAMRGRYDQYSTTSRNDFHSPAKEGAKKPDSSNGSEKFKSAEMPKKPEVKKGVDMPKRPELTKRPDAVDRLNVGRNSTQPAANSRSNTRDTGDLFSKKLIETDKRRSSSESQNKSSYRPSDSKSDKNNKPTRPRAPLPPQKVPESRTPRDSSKVSRSTTPANSSSAARRIPLPPQRAPTPENRSEGSNNRSSRSEKRDGSSYNQRNTQPDRRESYQPDRKNGTNGSSQRPQPQQDRNGPLHYQQQSRNSFDNSRTTSRGSSNYNSYTRTSDRSSHGSNSGRSGSSGPLPPPSLPPPRPSSNLSDSSRQGKRSYNGDNQRDDKRRRY